MKSGAHSMPLDIACKTQTNAGDLASIAVYKDYYTSDLAIIQTSIEMYVHRQKDSQRHALATMQALPSGQSDRLPNTRVNIGTRRSSTLQPRPEAILG